MLKSLVYKLISILNLLYLKLKYVYSIIKEYNKELKYNDLELEEDCTKQSLNSKLQSLNSKLKYTFLYTDKMQVQIYIYQYSDNYYNNIDYNKIKIVYKPIEGKYNSILITQTIKDIAQIISVAVSYNIKITLYVDCIITNYNVPDYMPEVLPSTCHIRTLNTTDILSSESSVEDILLVSLKTKQYSYHSSMTVNTIYLDIFVYGDNNKENTVKLFNKIVLPRTIKHKYYTCDNIKNL